MMNLDRFAQGLKDPQEEIPVAHCEHCGEEIYEGEKVIYQDGFYYCSEDCYASEMLKNGLCERVSAHAS